MPEPLKILLSEGSSTSASQTLYALGRLGHVIDVCDPQRLCLARFSRYVRRFYRCPSFTADPLGYLNFLSERLRRERYDVLLPVHDQVYLLSRFSEMFAGRVGLAVPPFEAVAQLQSKAGFSRLLAALDLPQPRTTVVCDPAELPKACSYPCYVKLAYGTAGRGVWRVDTPRELDRVIESLGTAASFAPVGPVCRTGPGSGSASRTYQQGHAEIVVQEAVDGVFHVAQAVFQHGELAAAGCYRARAAGVGGSAHARESVTRPIVYEHLARLGRHLAWHGALHIEFLCDPATDMPVYIEVNPRIGETMNATLSGLNLCDILVRVSLGEEVPRGVFSREGVRTHSVLMSMMAAAERGEGRRGILGELRRAWKGQGVYHDSQDELTRPREDAWSLLPALFVTAKLLAAPGSVARTVRRAVDNYALTAEAVCKIAALPHGPCASHDDHTPPACAADGQLITEDRRP
jgi:hypothetical protein